jgi:hypothetical protein
MIPMTTETATMLKRPRARGNNLIQAEMGRYKPLFVGRRTEIERRSGRSILDSCFNPHYTVECNGFFMLQLSVSLSFYLRCRDFIGAALGVTDEDSGHVM